MVIKMADSGRWSHRLIAIILVWISKPYGEVDCFLSQVIQGIESSMSTCPKEEKRTQQNATVAEKNLTYIPCSTILGGKTAGNSFFSRQDSTDKPCV